MDKLYFSEIKSHYDWVDSIGLLFASVISLTLFTRLLNFFKTTSIHIPLIFISLFVFFFLLFTFFLNPIIKYLINNNSAFYAIIIVAALSVSVLYILIPYKNVPFRTTHRLSVSVPSYSNDVILEGLSDLANKPIPIEEIFPDQNIQDIDIQIKPGTSFEFTRAMTGGLKFKVTSEKTDADVIIQWDNQQETLTLLPGETKHIQTDPASWGMPSRLIHFLMIVVIISEWFAYVLLIIITLGFLHGIINKQKQIYNIHLQKLKTLLSDYLILNSLLITLAIFEGLFPHTTQIYNFYILTPGFLYLLLKLFTTQYPVTPLIILFIGILINTYFSLNLTPTSTLRARHIERDSFNAFAQDVNPRETTFISVGFYKQLHNSALFLSPNSIFTEKYDQDRLLLMNQLSEIRIVDYPDKLPSSKYFEFINSSAWTQWEKRSGGSYYFYKTEIPSTSPIAVFTYEEDIFLIPTNLTEELGLFHDFILN